MVSERKRPINVSPSDEFLPWDVIIIRRKCDCGTELLKLFALSTTHTRVCVRAYVSVCPAHSCACVCVCVCAREKKEKRAGIIFLLLKVWPAAAFQMGHPLSILHGSFMGGQIFRPVGTTNNGRRVRV